MGRVISYDNMGILRNAMGASALRHEILADNIANIDTPGFKRSDVSFQTELSRALSREPRIELNRTSGRHLEGTVTRDPMRVKSRVYAEMDTWTRNDKNNVDPEVEMSHVAQNTLYYQTLTNRIASSYRNLTNIVQRSSGL